MIASPLSSRRCWVLLLALGMLALLSLSFSPCSDPSLTTSVSAARKKGLTEAQLRAIEDQWMEDEVEDEGQANVH
jgi:hypothetical protein